MDDNPASKNFRFITENLLSTDNIRASDEAWDQLKGREIPKTHQEFVDSKQRLRTAVRKLRAIEDLPRSDNYRSYRITDYQEQRETERKLIIPVHFEIKDLPVLPKRISSRKVKIEKCMYYEDPLSDSWSQDAKPPRKSKKRGSPRKNTNLKEFGAWDQLKGRNIPKTHQEFVDSKQRLRAALRNLKTIEEVPCTGNYRRYGITDYQEQRETKSKVKIPVHFEENLPALPRRKHNRKAKIEKCMYYEDSSSDSWTPDVKSSRKSKKSGSFRKNTTLKKFGKVIFHLLSMATWKYRRHVTKSHTHNNHVKEEGRGEISEQNISHIIKDEIISKAVDTGIKPIKKEKDVIPEEGTGGTAKKKQGLFQKQGYQDH